MFKFVIIAILAFFGWLYFTDSGKSFYSEHLEEKKPEPPKFVPDAVLVKSITAELDVVKRKLEHDRSALKLREKENAKAKAAGKRVDFAPDVGLLQRSIDRLVEEEARLQQRLDRALTDPKMVDPLR
jgi:hypothetical protein